MHRVYGNLGMALLPDQGKTLSDVIAEISQKATFDISTF